MAGRDRGVVANALAVMGESSDSPNWLLTQRRYRNHAAKMPKLSRKIPMEASRSFALRPHDPDGTWESNDGRYRLYAHELLGEHKALCADVIRLWPKDAGSAITNPLQYPEITRLAKKRDQSSDTTRIFAAMAVEGYLNFYGVLRLGQQVFDEHFERMGLVPKLRALLLFCDQLNIPRNDPLVLALDNIARSRNLLVHPKAIEVVGNPATHQRSSFPMPQTAEQAVANMELFFDAFVAAVPEAANHLKKRDVI